MSIIAPDIAYVDLEFQRLHRVIGTLFLQGRGGITIVDPGPSTTLATLRQHLAGIGAAIDDVTAVFLTHIHLDHAGATGVIVGENPRIKVHVHERGAPHIVDPAKLVASASRLYGEMMQALWGEILPVPADAVVPLFGGERLEAGGRTWDVAYTPGHASHHVSYFSADLGLALVGDTAGVQVVRGGFVLPPTPPPDIDLPVWRSSLSLIERWRPRSLFLTHFGVVDEPAAHVAELRDHLDLCERLAREAVARSTDPAEQEAWFTDQMRATIARGTNAADLEAYEVAGRIDLNWRGLERYLRKGSSLRS
jgi:glyoxylase-like metal-dependent hydrolase (beta-lactamase superfamily II)